MLNPQGVQPGLVSRLTVRIAGVCLGRKWFNKRSRLVQLFFCFVGLIVIVSLVACYLKQFSMPILNGMILGSIYSFVAFFWLMVSAHRAVSMPAMAARRFMRRSYARRCLAFALLFVFVLKCQFLCGWAFFLPMLVPKYYLMCSQLGGVLRQSKGKAKKLTTKKIEGGAGDDVCKELQ
jgi:hypothetical protein